MPSPAKTPPTTHRVVCAIDSQMVYALCVALHSLQRHTSAPFGLTVGYLEGTLPEGDREYLSAVISHLGIDHQFSNLGSDKRFITQGHISPTTFAKFLLADSHPQPHLWIDADTIGLAGWDDLFAHIHEATTAQGLVVAKREEGATGLAFNAGVLGWPAGARRQWSDHLNTLQVIDTQEQYLFNLLYADTAMRVSERFNALTYRVDSLSSTTPPFIIHYAGAHKPWHMPRRHAHRCLSYRCPWSEWFIAESEFLDDLGDSALLQDTLPRRQRALRSGALRWQRDHRGLLFLRALQSLGPLGGALIAILLALVRFVPRGTHPVHREKR